MIIVARFVLALLISIGNAFAEGATPDAQQLLLKMTRAMANLNYQGTIAFLRNGKLEPMKYSHTFENGVEQERLESLNSPLRVITRNEDEISCFFKETKQKIVHRKPFERSFLIGITKNINELVQDYDFKLAGEQDVAMLPAYVIEIQPKDKYRYSRKIWVEQHYFLPLKVEVYDLSGKPIELADFTEIQINKAPAMSMQNSNSSLQVPKLQTSLLSQINFVVNQLPHGFQAIFYSRSPMHQTGQLVDHLLLSDGLANISIYMENKPASLSTSGLEGLQSIDGVYSYSRSLNKFQFTVLGEVPAETVKLIAEGIKLKDVPH